VRTDTKLTFEAGILSVIIALLRRGRIRLLAELDIKSIWIVFIPAAIIITSVIVGQFMEKQLWIKTTGMLHIAATVAFLVFFWANRRLPGMKWFIAGWILNLFPVAFNAGKMPVSKWAASVAGMEKVLANPDMMRHVAMSTSTKFNFLGDIFPSPKPIPGVFSIGDVLMMIGIFILIQVTMCPKKPKLPPKEAEGSRN